MNKEIRAVDILNILDEEAATYNFPMPDNLNIYSAGMRLTSFRSELEWLIVFEMMNYTKNHEFANEICAFGNKLKQQGFAFPSPIVMEALQPS
ncbi:MAG: hypothetical protein HGA25_11810, partial [Clostridiales bacterium]|nr:hypothetical protein [Clostridiales bacterium]